MSDLNKEKLSLEVYNSDFDIDQIKKIHKEEIVKLFEEDFIVNNLECCGDLCIKKMEEELIEIKNILEKIKKTKKFNQEKKEELEQKEKFFDQNIKDFRKKIAGQQYYGQKIQNIKENRIIKDIIELNADNDSIDNFKQLIQNNKNNNKRHYYTIHTTENTNEHWLNVIQEGEKVLVIDSLGTGKISDNIFEKFIKDKSSSNIKYYRSSTQLQYSSGVCEMYAIKLPFYLLKQEIFNNVELQPFEQILSNNPNDLLFDEEHLKTLKYFSVSTENLNKFNPILENGLNELPFGIQKSKEKSRIEALTAQINNIKKEKEKLIYSVRKLAEHQELEVTSFNEMFLKDLEDAKKILFQLKETEQKDIYEAICELLSSLEIKNILDKKNQDANEKKEIEEYKKNLNIKSIENKDLITLHDIILDNNKKEIFNFLLNRKTNIDCILKISEEEEYNKLIKNDSFEKLAFKEFQIVAKYFNDIRNSKAVSDNLKKKDLADCYNDKFSLKAGHMYWQTASALKEFEEQEQEKEQAIRENMDLAGF